MGPLPSRALFVMSLCCVAAGITVRPTWGKTWFESDGYYAHDTTPLEVYGKPVGTSGTLNIRLPKTFDCKSAPLAVLWLWVDDIDAPRETSIHINGHGPLEPPRSVIGEGAEGHRGYLRVDASILKPGMNEVKFVFEDNLKGTTAGFEIYEAAIVLVRLDGKTTSLPMIAREVYIDVKGFGLLAVYDSSLEPRAIRMQPSEDPCGWKEHTIVKRDRKGGWVCVPGQFRFMHCPYGEWMSPFGMVQMDNREVILAATWKDGVKANRIVLASSRDRGATWGDWRNIPGGFGRPMMLAALGKGEVTFATGWRFFSHDYGRTWSEKLRIRRTRLGGHFCQEGNALVDRDAKGNVIRIMEIGYDAGGGGRRWNPANPSHSFIRWSTDRGRTWTGDLSPRQWRWETEHEGKTYVRSVDEGSLVRASNGWIVAALRTNMPPKFIPTYNDNYEGIGVSISRDDGKTWSPVEVIYPAGRMHAHLLRLPNGDLVMGYIVRQDVGQDLTFTSYRRGCEAIVSRDNGLNWDTDRRYVLNSWQYLDGEKAPKQTLACGHTCSVLLDNGYILTAHGHYTSKGIAMIRWRP